MTIVEKAAYLKGLTDGLGLEPDSRDGKLWNALNDLLSDMAHEIEDLQATTGLCRDAGRHLRGSGLSGGADLRSGRPGGSGRGFDDDEDEDGYRVSEDEEASPTPRVYDGEDEE